MAARYTISLFITLLLVLTLRPSPVGATPPLPPEAATLSEDEQWLLWQNQFTRPPIEPVGEWISRELPHFRFHFLPGSAAERDWPLIAQEAEQSLRRVLARLDMQYDDQLDVYLVERVFWQGGAAYGDGEVLISYLDRNYTNIPLTYYLDHELTHAMAFTLIPEGGETNSVLAEGLATWATGGHYGPEPIHPLAAALPSMERYVPLAQLLRDFRAAQHEIAYIESASFVGWLVEQYGLETVKAFYGSADEPERFFDASYETLEAEWLQWLEQEWGRDVAHHRAWWEAQIRFFDTMRSYEEQFDPFARELPDSPREWPLALRLQYGDNVDTAHAIALESHLIAASEYLVCNDDPAASQALLDEVEATVEQGRISGEGALAQRLAVAELLAAQDRALQQRNGAAWMATAAPAMHQQVAWTLLDMARHGPLRQESVWVEPQGEQVSALVAWYPLRGGQARAFHLTFAPHGEGWRVQQMRPFATDLLIPRSERLCRS